MRRDIPLRTVALFVCLLALGVGGASGRALDTTTIVVQVDGGGLVTGGGGQISCGGGATSCYATFITTGTVDLQALDQAGWTFAVSGWEGCPDIDTTDDSKCHVPLDGSTYEVTADFTTGTSPGTKMLTVTQPTGGDISNPGGDVDCGSEPAETDCTFVVTTDSTVTVLEDPDTGNTFSGWGGDCGGLGVSCTVTMSDDRDVGATFSQSATTFALTVSVTGNGTVAGPSISCTSTGGSSCSADESAGATVTLTAQPDTGASFSGWGGACAGVDLTCSVTMSSARSVTASFSGSGTGPPASSFPLGVSVSGNGAVTGGGIDCGSGATDCTVSLASGTTVTLTAKPDTGASFTSWGGACSASATTCSVTMNAAKSVTATFTTGGSGGGTGGGGAAGAITLSVSVTGPGSVGGGGIECGNGGKTCSATEGKDSNVTLTATPAANAVFVGWNGACNGTARTCTVTMDASKSATAVFRATSRAPTAAVGGKALASRGPAIVRRTANGFLVTLRFVSRRRGIAKVRAILAGRLQTALSFPVAPGTATVGPFPVVKPGFYTFEVSLGASHVHWVACLGRCGSAAHAPPFVLARGPAKAIDTGAAWSVTLKYRASLPSGTELRVLRSGRLVRTMRLPAPAGAVTAGPLLLTPGAYRLHLTATDAYGRVRHLAWYAFLS